MNNQHWTSNDIAAFRASIKNTLLFKLDGYPSQPTDRQDDIADKLEGQFWLAYASDEGAVSAQEASNHFRQWVADGRYDLRSFVAERQISVGISRSYGGEQITMSCSGSFTIQSPLDVNRATEALLKEIDQAIAHYESLLPGRNIPDAAKASPQSAEENDLIDASRISVSVDNGKRRYRVHGGRWERYGVPIYPEVAKRCGLNDDAIPLEGLALDGWEATIEMIDGKPRRVKDLKQRV